MCRRKQTKHPLTTTMTGKKSGIVKLPVFCYHFSFNFFRWGRLGNLKQFRERKKKGILVGRSSSWLFILHNRIGRLWSKSENLGCCYSRGLNPLPTLVSQKPKLMSFGVAVHVPCYFGASIWFWSGEFCPLISFCPSHGLGDRDVTWCNNKFQIVCQN